MTGNTSKKDDIAATFDVFGRNGVCEIRAFDGRKYIYSGYFNDIEAFVKAARTLDRDGQGYVQKKTTYITMNPVKPDLLARRNNKIGSVGKDDCTSNPDISRRKWLLIDMDPTRPSGIPATDEEKLLALKKTEEVNNALHDRWGIPNVGLADSGNGYHILVPVDLPNNEESVLLVKNALAALDHLYSDKRVKVDSGTFNAARVTKLYGTKPHKGEGTKERPNRRSEWLLIPESGFTPVDAGTLNAIAAELPEAKPKSGSAGAKKSKGKNMEPLDVPAFLAAHGIEVLKESTWTSGPGEWKDAAMWIVPCPYGNHGPDLACHIMQASSGKLSARCKHNHCKDYEWQDFRTHYEPDAYEPAKQGDGAALTTKKKSGKKSKKNDEEEVGDTKLLSDAICEDNHFAVDAGGRLYRYANGAYRVGAERYIKRRVKHLLEEWEKTEAWSSYRANEVVAYISADAPELWERPERDRINVLNGLLNVYTQELEPHSPEWLSPVQIPITYDVDAKCPAWGKYVEPCFPKDAPMLPYEIFASMLTPYRATQKAVLLLGEGSNGKSTYLSAIMTALGKKNCRSISLQKLETNRFAVAELVGMLANICPDLPSTHLAETSVFKALTGDEGQMSAEFKYRDSFEFEPFCQLVFSANHPPKSQDASHAFFRRWVVAPFNRTFAEDPKEVGESEQERSWEGEEEHIIEKLIPREELDATLAQPSELSGVLNKALSVLPGLRKNGFTESPLMRKAWEEYKGMTDPVSVFLAQKTIEHPEAYVPKSRLLNAFNEEATHALTAKSFSMAVKRYYPNVEEGKRTVDEVRHNCWVGIGFKSELPDPDPNPDVPVKYENPPTTNNGLPVQGVQGVQGSTTVKYLLDPPSLEIKKKAESVNNNNKGTLDTLDTSDSSESTAARLVTAGWKRSKRAGEGFWINPTTGYAYSEQYALAELERGEHDTE